MSGFDNMRFNHEFFAGTHVKSTFYAPLDMPIRHHLIQGGARFDFDEVCQLL